MGEDELEWPPDPMGSRPRVSASRRAYEHVKERILEGTLPGTWLLSENEVAEELGISRTPVRTAFGRLEAEGYLTLYPKRGAIVTPISPREAEEVIEARWVIERHALEQARPELGAELATLAEPGEADFAEADRAFHRALVASTDNAILLGLYDTLRDRQRRMLRAGSRTGERKAAIVAEHRELADAVAAGDRAAATAILRRHLDNALAALR
jgi:DNA-binding GntR family transcriptional regulator